jgi:hypothetical protein
MNNEDNEIIVLSLSTPVLMALMKTASNIHSDESEVVTRLIIEDVTGERYTPELRKAFEEAR